MSTTMASACLTIRASILDVEQVNGLWDVIAPKLERVPGFDEYYTADYIFECIRKKVMQVWAFGEECDPVPRTIVITQVVVYPKKKVLMVLWVFGRDFKRYSDAGSWLLDRFAEIASADTISFRGRNGWVRLLKKQGFHKDGVLMSRPVGARWSH